VVATGTCGVDSVSEIRLDARQSGVRAVYMIEVRGRGDATEVAKLFRELESHVQVRQLSSGRLVSYAVEAHAADSAILDAIEDVLRDSCAFVIVHRVFDDVAVRVLTELCRETGSRMMAMPRCGICGKPEPFPATSVILSNGPEAPPIDRGYCARCTAVAARPTNGEFVRSLLAADRRGFGHLAEARFERHPSHRSPVRFRVGL